MSRKMIQALMAGVSMIAMMSAAQAHNNVNVDMAVASAPAAATFIDRTVNNDPVDLYGTTFTPAAHTDFVNTGGAAPLWDVAPANDVAPVPAAANNPPTPGVTGSAPVAADTGVSHTAKPAPLDLSYVGTHGAGASSVVLKTPASPFVKKTFSNDDAPAFAPDNATEPSAKMVPSDTLYSFGVSLSNMPTILMAGKGKQFGIDLSRIVYHGNSVKFNLFAGLTSFRDTAISNTKYDFSVRNMIARTGNNPDDFTSGDVTGGASFKRREGMEGGTAKLGAGFSAPAYARFGGQFSLEGIAINPGASAKFSAFAYAQTNGFGVKIPSITVPTSGINYNGQVISGVLPNGDDYSFNIPGFNLPAGKEYKIEIPGFTLPNGKKYDGRTVTIKVPNGKTYDARTVAIANSAWEESVDIYNRKSDRKILYGAGNLSLGAAGSVTPNVSVVGVASARMGMERSAYYAGAGLLYESDRDPDLGQNISSVCQDGVFKKAVKKALSFTFGAVACFQRTTKDYVSTSLQNTANAIRDRINKEKETYYEHRFTMLNDALSDENIAEAKEDITNRLVTECQKDGQPEATCNAIPGNVETAVNRVDFTQIRNDINNINNRSITSNDVLKAMGYVPTTGQVVPSFRLVAGINTGNHSLTFSAQIDPKTKDKKFMAGYRLAF